MQEFTNEQNDTSINDNSRQIIDRIKVSPSISSLEEQMRKPIWMQINRQRKKAERRVIYLKTVTIAASISILIGITIYASYQWGYQSRNTQLVYLENPTGVKSSVKLPDGTKVTMNAGSTLSYPAEFVSDSREVEISGEAYFDVAPDKKRPFIVKAENIRVHVLSTLFNVKAYRNDQAIEVTLEEGLVKIESDHLPETVFIKPGEQIRYDKTTRQYTSLKVNPGNFTGWREGRLYFTGSSLGDIAKELERKFNVQIIIDSEELKQIAFTGDFVRNETLEQILRVMTIDNRINYTIEESQVRIYKN